VSFLSDLREATALERERLEIANATEQTVGRQVALVREAAQLAQSAAPNLERIAGSASRGPAGSPPAGATGGAAPNLSPNAFSTASSGGGGGAAGGGGPGTGRLVGDRILSRNTVGAFRTAAQLDSECQRVELDVFLPGSPEPVKVSGWRCPGGDEYLDPEEFQALLQGKFGSRSAVSAPGNYSRGSGNPKPPRVTFAGTPTGQVGVGGNTPINEGGRIGAAGSSTARPRISPGEERIERAILDANRALIDEIKRKPSGIESRARGRD
jgi:hypothetical protein